MHRGKAKGIVTDGLRSYGAALNESGASDRQEVGRWVNTWRKFVPALQDDGGRCSGFGR